MGRKRERRRFGDRDSEACGVVGLRGTHTPCLDGWHWTCGKDIYHIMSLVFAVALQGAGGSAGSAALSIWQCRL